MTTQPVKLFYSYAHEDEALRNQLNTHLSLLKRQGFISDWSDHEIAPGSDWAKDIDEHLMSARIILLLISPDFMVSDYCYGVEMQKVLEKHEKKNALVIPIILRPVDWEGAPFGKLKALPNRAKPVTMWANRDAAFADIVKNIRIQIEAWNKIPSVAEEQAAYAGKNKRMRGEEIGGKSMNDTTETRAIPAEIDEAALGKLIGIYYKGLKELDGKADYELALRFAFQNLLTSAARQVQWTLIAEQTIEGSIRPDGVLRDINNLRRGYWEAKGPNGDLEKEISDKIKKNYPLTNTVFENTRLAVLYQDTRRVFECDMQNIDELKDLLKLFLTHTEPHIEKFQSAVLEFKRRIPGLAADLIALIGNEHKKNQKFENAFVAFADMCRNALDPKISPKTLDEMLVQHLLTERIFRTVFNNPDFVNRNAIASEIEKVIQALTSRTFNRYEFLKSLDRYYIAIEGTAKGTTSWEERQEFLNSVYEGFFQGFSTKQADTHGIVYTPQEIVDFMVESVDEVLKREFGKSIETPGVKILDPATGTGNFIVNIIRRIDEYNLEKKYKEDLFCNEIMLLPYYIASLNIEHEYYAKMGQYEPFEGICFADTLELIEGKQGTFELFVEENTERVKREKEADIMVVIGNPPYNVGQKSENDNNKNRKYPLIDTRIRETYAKDSRASNKNALGDAYVKFFRWAADRLGDRDGIVCLVTNNSFVDQIAFDGMRKHLQKDFTQIFHLDLHGNVRKNPKLSGTTHNVFGIQVGVGITLAVRNSRATQSTLKYYRVTEYSRKQEKLAFLGKRKNIEGIDWIDLQPDEKSTWITEGIKTDFSTFIPLGTKDNKASLLESTDTIFRIYGGGIKTNRDNWVYDFDRDKLKDKVNRLINAYNVEVFRWRSVTDKNKNVNDFFTYDDTNIKWSEGLKNNLIRGKIIEFEEDNIRQSLYRPFCREWLFFDRNLVERVYQFPQILPNPATEEESRVICLSGIGSNKPFHCLASKIIPCLDVLEKTQCFPFYTYSTDGSNRRENIQAWALKRFQEKYGLEVTKWDIFHYVYSMLHHPQYRDLYKENLKRDLPHIPLLLNREGFEACVSVGKQLMDLHVNYEQAEEYPLKSVSDKEIPFLQRLRVEKMKLSVDKTSLVYSKGLTLEGIPQECFEYRLGNRSALEWVIDQYQVSMDKRSAIESDPNRLDDPQYIVRLVKQIVMVSVKTVALVKELAEAVAAEDWSEASVNLIENPVV